MIDAPAKRAVGRTLTQGVLYVLAGMVEERRILGIDDEEARYAFSANAGQAEGAHPELYEPFVKVELTGLDPVNVLGGDGERYPSLQAARDAAEWHARRADQLLDGAEA